MTADYDDQDRLLRYGDMAFTYTANGELASRTQGGQTVTYERVYYYTLQGDPTSAWLVRVITFDAHGITKRVTRSVYFD